MGSLPDLITHIYDPARGPFRNVCAEPVDCQQGILDSIAHSGLRSFKPTYLARRRETEAWLLARRTAKLGAPKLQHPIYFFLGDFDDGLDRSRPQAVKLPLSTLPRCHVTFTYPDSMASMPLGRDDGKGRRQPYLGEVFTLDEIERVVALHGMPQRPLIDDPSNGAAHYIEVQVWDDAALPRLHHRDHG